MDCVFCKIVEKKIPSQIVYEDKFSMAFLDIHPLNLGHTLIVPKKHYETIGDIPEDEFAELAKAVKKVAVAAKKATGAHGINITQNNGRAAEQIVPHIHFHVIPRIEGDGIRTFNPKREFSKEEMDEIAEKIKSAV
jgi:histidine triad (HIT) family protein